MNGDGVAQLALTEDGSQVLYQAAQDSVYWELFRVDLATPGVATKMSSTALPAGAEVWDFANAPGLHSP